MSKEHIIWSDTIFKDRKSMERWAADVREMLIDVPMSAIQVPSPSKSNRP